VNKAVIIAGAHKRQLATAQLMRMPRLINQVFTT